MTRAATAMPGFTLIELMVALAIARAAAPARHAVVHDLPAQQRDPLDGRVDRQRPAHGQRRGREPQSRASRSRSPAAATPAGRSISSRIRMTNELEERRSRRIAKQGSRDAAPSRRSPPRASSRSGSTALVESTTRGCADDHLQQIDVDSTVSGEARPLRIIVDDPNPADPAKPRGLRLCDPDPALSALVPPDPRAC